MKCTYPVLGDPPLSIGGDHEMEIVASFDEVMPVLASCSGMEGGNGEQVRVSDCEHLTSLYSP